MTTVGIVFGASDSSRLLVFEVRGGGVCVCVLVLRVTEVIFIVVCEVTSDRGQFLEGQRHLVGADVGLGRLQLVPAHLASGA